MAVYFRVAILFGLAIMTGSVRVRDRNGRNGIGSKKEHLLRGHDGDELFDAIAIPQKMKMHRCSWSGRPDRLEDYLTGPQLVDPQSYYYGRSRNLIDSGGDGKCRISPPPWD